MRNVNLTGAAVSPDKMPGQPKPAPNRRRNVCVSVRMTPAEKETLDRNAEKAGLSRTEYVIRNALDKGVCVFGSKEQMDQLIREVNRIGVNINQIAKVFNRGMVHTGSHQIEKLQKDFEKLTDLVLLMIG